jgi:hypothetical protein
MANTMGTNAQTTLTSYTWTPDMAAANLAALAALIMDDGAAFSAGGSKYNPFTVEDNQASSSRGQIPGAITRAGQLVIPNRGILRIMPGDRIGVDANGWPILVSGSAIAGTYAGTSWTTA